jgi:hypothetical protein
VEKDYLILKHASASRPSGKWNEDDFDVLAEGAVVGRIFKANAAPVGSPWMWTLLFGYHEDSHPDTWLRCDTRGGDGCIRQQLAARIMAALVPQRSVFRTRVLAINAIQPMNASVFTAA